MGLVLGVTLLRDLFSFWLGLNWEKIEVLVLYLSQLQKELLDHKTELELKKARNNCLSISRTLSSLSFLC